MMRSFTVGNFVTHEIKGKCKILEVHDDHLLLSKELVDKEANDVFKAKIKHKKSRNVRRKDPWKLFKKRSRWK